MHTLLGENFEIWAEVENRLLEGVIIKDIQRDVMLYVNDAAAEYVGASSAEAMIGRPSSEFYPKTYKEYHADDVEIYRSGRGRYRYLESYTDLYGKKHQILTSKWPVTIEGRKCVVLTFVDVTEIISAVNASQDYGRAFDAENLRKTQEESRRLIQVLYG